MGMRNGTQLIPSTGRVRLLGEAHEVVRPVCVSVGAMAVAACAMSLPGRPVGGLALMVVITIVAGVLIFLVDRAVGHLLRQSTDARRSAAEAEKHYVDVLGRILKFVEAHDKYRAGHCRRVGKLSEQIARRLGLDENYCALLNLAGQLHDIGLLAVPNQILTQRSRIGVEAFRTIKKHPDVAYEILRPLESLREILPAIRHHHERMNGTGYPDGLVGEAIPLCARILATADSFDAMTHDRPHRPAMAPLVAMTELLRCCPDGYDPACVEALGKVMNLTALAGAARRCPGGQARGPQVSAATS